MEDAAMDSEQSQLQYRRTASCLALCCVSFGFNCALAQEIYKSTDAQGHTIYSDRPLSRNAERVNTAPAPRGAAQAQGGEAQTGVAQTGEAQRLASLQKMLEERDAEIAKNNAAAAEKAEADKEKTERCAAARSQYYLFTQGRPPHRIDAAGNYTYYTNAELDAQRQSTKQKMDEACATEQR
jgi:hypothetical protein